MSDDPTERRAEERRVVGWYVEIPRDLRRQFDELYPGRRNKKILTITAIQHAIALHPKSLHNLYKGGGSGVEPTQEHAQGSGSESSGGPEDGSEHRESSSELGADDD